MCSESPAFICAHSPVAASPELPPGLLSPALPLMAKGNNVFSSEGTRWPTYLPFAWDVGGSNGVSSQSDPRGNLCDMGLKSATVWFRPRLGLNLLFKCHQLTVEHLLCAFSHIILFNP